MINISARRARRMARPAAMTQISGAGHTEKSESASAPTISQRPSKSDIVLGLLRRSEGATLDQLMQATGWLGHSTRAALTGLRKKGHVLLSEKPPEGSRIYQIAGSDLRVTLANGE